MYTIVSAIAIKKGVNQRWLTYIKTDIENLIVSRVLKEYRKFYVQVDNGVNSPFWFELHSLQAYESNNTDTLALWLQLPMSYSLTAVSVPELRHRTSSYSCASQAGYVATAWDTIYMDTQPALTRKHLLMRRQVPSTDYESYNKHCLTTVSGLLHYTDNYIGSSQHKGVFIEDGINTMRKSMEPNIGIWSFHGVSTINRIKITKEMLSLDADVDPESDCSDKIKLALPNSALNKPVMLSVGGHACFMGDNTFNWVLPNTLRLNLNINNSMVDRYYQMSSRLNIVSYQELVNPDRLQYVDKNKLLTYKAIEKLLLLSQSFIVVFDNPHVYFEASNALRSDSPFLYTTVVKPNGPIIGLQGLLPEHWLIKEPHRYGLRICANIKPQYRPLDKDPVVTTLAENASGSDNAILYNQHLMRQSEKYIRVLEAGTDIFH